MIRKRFSKIEILVNFGIVFLAAFLLAKEARSAEALKVSFDERPWQQVYQGGDGEHRLVQYQLKEEKDKPWSELVSVEFFPGLHKKRTLKQLVQAQISAIFEQCAVGDWTIHEETNEAILYEWAVRLCPNFSDQRELVYVLKGKEGVHAVHYTVKQRTWKPGQREKWMALLKQTELVE